MDRRAFIGSLAVGTLAVPRSAPAQPARKVYRIGILALGVTANMVGPQPRDPSNNALLRGLRELGRRPKVPPGSGGGSCCCSRSETPANSKGPSEQQRALGPALSL